MGLIAALAVRGVVAQPRSLVVLVVAVAIGVGFQIPNTANLAGSSATLLEEELTLGAGDVRIEPRDRPRFAAADGIVARVAEVLPGTRIVEMIVVPGGIAASGSRFLGAAVLGVDFAAARMRITEGVTPAPGELGVVLGSAIARRLPARVGDAIELRVVLGKPGSELDDAGAYTMSVRGIAGNTAAVNSVFVERGFLAQELQDPGTASLIIVHLADHDAAPAAAKAIERAISGVRAIDWKADDPLVPTVVRANRVIERVSYSMVVAAISVTLLALLYIRARRNRREIAVLRAVGFTRRAVFAIHVIQALAISCIGCALGAVIGLAALALFDRFPIFTWETMVVRPLWTPATFVFPIAAALGASVLAGVIAAFYATRTDPARVLQQLD